MRGRKVRLASNAGGEREAKFLVPISSLPIFFLPLVRAKPL